MVDQRTLSAVDAMWLGMDRPDNLMVIDSLVWLDDAVDRHRFRAILQDRVVDQFPVFRQRPVEATAGLGRPTWRDDPDFDLDRHFRQATLPAPGDEPALQRYVEAQMRHPLDRDHPVWEVHLLDGYRLPDGSPGNVVLFRFHHAIADGGALVQLLMSLTDSSAQPEPMADGAWQPPTAGTVPHGLGDQLREAGGQLVHAGTQLFHLAEGLPRLLSPTGVGQALSLLEQTAKVADKLLLRSDPPSMLHGPIGPEKRAAWSRPRPLDDVRTVGRNWNATVNDVLLSALAGALSQWLSDQGELPADLTTMVPVDLRPPGTPLSRDLGNQFALVFLRMPTGRWTRQQRLAETKSRMDEIKHSPETTLTFGVSEGIGLIGASAGKPLVDFFADKAIGVTTNVIGPAQVRYLAGGKVVGLLGWVPGSGRQALGACIASYAGTVRVGFKVDAAAVGDPAAIVTAFDDELDRLVAAAANGHRRPAGTRRPPPPIEPAPPIEPTPPPPATPTKKTPTKKAATPRTPTKKAPTKKAPPGD